MVPVLTKVQSSVHLDVMKTVPVTELRRRISDVIEQLETDEGPTLVLQRSRKAAYIVNPDRYEADQAELRALRREVFLAGVKEAEAEIAAGQVREYADVEELIKDIWD